MDNFYQKALKKIEVFFKGDLNSSGAIFDALKTVIHFKNAYIYFLTPELLRLEYASGKTPVAKEIKLSRELSRNLFDITAKIKEEIFKNFCPPAAICRLAISRTVYGILVLEIETELSKEESDILNTCSLIISNLIKELELSRIIKLQTESLQQGIIKTGKTNRIIKTENRKILESDKIRTRFFSNISHELRTPLNSIIGFSELLQNPASGTLNPKQTEFIQDIQTAGIHLLGMINEVLDMTKIESNAMKLNLREFEISRCIAETLNILKPLYQRKNLKINLNIEDTLIRADYQKVQQILFNIINNAIKYSPDGESITISTQKKKKYLEIRIKDRGCGIDKKYHRKIFKKFEQIEARENSTGLGLAITKELTEMHNGKIKVISSKGEGAEFYIRLPLSAE